MDELSTYEIVKVIGGALFAVLLALRMLSKRNPDAPWLQWFRNAFPDPPVEQQRRFARRANIYIGAQLILMAFVIPLGYLALTVMMFHDFTRLGIALTAAASLLCFGLGVAAMWSNRRI